MLFFLFLCIQGIHHDVRVRVCDDGLVGMVNHHAGLAVGYLLHLLHRGYVNGDVLTAAGFGVVGCQLGCLGDGCLVAAGSVVTGKTAAPAGWLLMGNPAKLVRNLAPEELMASLKNATDYVALGHKTFGKE